MKRVVFIINQHARGAESIWVAQAARRKLIGFELEFWWPEDLKALHQRLKSLNRKNCYAIVTVGGDGTINKLLPFALESQIPVLPLPGGTANDFSRELGISYDWTQVQNMLALKAIAAVDVIAVNDAHFITIGGVGLGSKLTSLVNQKRKSSLLFGAAFRYFSDESYRLLATKLIWLHQYETHQIRISSAKFMKKVTVAALFVCNQPNLGKHMLLAPAARLNNGKFEVVGVLGLGRKHFFSALRDVNRGETPMGTFRFSSEEMVIENIAGRPLGLFGDGETLPGSKRLAFKVHPQKLQVFMPDKLKDG